MKRFTKLVSLILAGAMVFALAGCSKNDGLTVKEGVLTWGTEAGFPPYEYREGDQVVGIDADIVNAIAEKLDMSAEVEDMNFDAVITSVQSGKVDIGVAGITASEDRAKMVDFTDPYTTATQVIIVKEGSSIKSADDLDGKTVGVQLGTTGDIYVSDMENVTVERSTRGSDAILSLTQGKIDAVVIDSEPAKKYVESNDGLVILDEPLTVEEYAIAVSKDNPELLEQVNTALGELKESGELQEIIDKYITAE
jgi:polar amino acid transport system substrate-binding protein